MTNSHEVPRQLKGLLTLGLITAAFGLYEYYTPKVEAAQPPDPTPTPVSSPLTIEFPTFSPSCLPTNFFSRQADIAYAGVYFFPGELDSMPGIQTGRANYYGGGETLNVSTSSGEPFDPEAMTAASWFDPLGTRVRVTDLTSGVSEIVRINDRGPDRILHPDVIIDLTRSAMRGLEPVAESAQVTVQPVCP